MLGVVNGRRKGGPSEGGAGQPSTVARQTAGLRRPRASIIMAES